MEHWETASVRGELALVVLILSSFDHPRFILLQWQRAKFIHRMLQNFDSLAPALLPTNTIVRLLREHGFSFSVEGRTRKVLLI